MGGSAIGKEADRTMTSRVIVVIACKNHALYLPAALSSVLTQTFSDWECIVVDNGSEDNSQEIARAFAREDDRIRSIENFIGGVGDARNLAVKLSSSPYILPLDADDMLQNNYLEAVVRCLEEECLEIVSAHAWQFGMINGYLHTREVTPDSMRIGNWIHSSSLFRRTSFDAVGGYYPTFNEGLEDWHLWCRILRKCWAFKRLPQTGLFYRRIAGSRSCRIPPAWWRAARKRIGAILENCPSNVKF